MEEEALKRIHSGLDPPSTPSPSPNHLQTLCTVSPRKSETQFATCCKPFADPLHPYAAPLSRWMCIYCLIFTLDRLSALDNL